MSSILTLQNTIELKAHYTVFWDQMFSGLSLWRFFITAEKVCSIREKAQEVLCRTLLHQQFCFFLVEEPRFFIQLLQFTLTVYQAPFFLPHCSLVIVVQVIQLLISPLKNLCQTKIDGFNVLIWQPLWLIKYK